MKTSLHICILSVGLFLLVDSSVVAQPMVYTTTPLQADGDRFFESTNMSWSLRGPNFFATFGGHQVGIPRFGGYTPNAGISSGWAFNSGQFSGNFRFSFSQGYERFSTTTTPSLMTTNGQTGYFFSGVRRPFVYSLGAFSSAPNPAFHQQFGCSGSVAERVLRGDLNLRNSINPATNPTGKVQYIVVDPATGRSNAAFAWFKDSSISSAGSATKPGSVTVEPEIESTGSQFIAKQHPSDEAAPAARIISSDTPATDSASQKIAEIYFQRGLDAAAQNDPAKARFFFDLAARRASGQFRQRVDDHLAGLSAE
jgi:hypothetical protein